MSFLSAIILLGVLIFVHEFGHFLFAKKLKVRVLKFSLGFGPKLIGRKFGETEYLISSIPLGGYVKMLGEEPGETLKEEDKPFAYNYQPVWKRFLIVASGPIFNLIFAAVLFFFVFLSGVPMPEPYIGTIVNNSPADKAGLSTGDKVIEINNIPVMSWYEINESVSKSKGNALAFKIEREGKIIELNVTPVKETEKNIFGEKIDVFEIGTSPLLYSYIGEVVSDSPAKKAGIEKGDRVIRIQDTDIKTWQEMTSIIHQNPGKPLRFKIKRGERILDIIVSPETKTITEPTGKRKDIGLIGIKPLANEVEKKFGLIDSLYLGFKRTWDICVLTLVVIVKLFQRIIPADTLGGPIMILQMAGEQASMGAMSFFSFMAVISINLGVLNLLPIPILDGGHLMFLTIEGIRRKPLSEKVIIICQKIGVALLITLMIFVLYNDVIRVVVPWVKKLFSI
ncbi:MAG: RIP metalloprotease RseP [Nitrospiraceae bacterium]|nr:RIP metalloprotease RseP [Nitrospiraceae bacterium]